MEKFKSRNEGATQEEKDDAELKHEENKIFLKIAGLASGLGASVFGSALIIPQKGPKDAAIAVGSIILSLGVINTIKYGSKVLFKNLKRH